MIDLHLHTNMSDGSDAPLELLEKVKAAGCKVFCKLYIEARKIAAALYEKGISDYEYVRRVTNWIADNVRYDHEALSRTTRPNMDSFEINNPLLAHKAVCSGKSKLFSLLCGLALIKTELVVGQARTDPSGLHAWNKVQIYIGNEKKWFNIDVTWTRRIASHRPASANNFLQCDADFEQTHIFKPNTFSEEYNMLNSFATQMYGSQYSIADTRI